MLDIRVHDSSYPREVEPAVGIKCAQHHQGDDRDGHEVGICGMKSIKRGFYFEGWGRSDCGRWQGVDWHIVAVVDFGSGGRICYVFGQTSYFLFLK